MVTHIAFLRAVNVAGHAVVKMERLKKAFEAAGCMNVRTVLQSGNVLYERASANSVVFKRGVLAALSEILGAQVMAAFRTLTDLRSLAGADPFSERRPGAEDKLYAAFLVRKPSMVPDFPLRMEKEGLEVIGMKGLDVFIVSRKVKERYGFPNIFIEKYFGAPATTRNWNTVVKIMEFAKGD